MLSDYDLVLDSLSFQTQFDNLTFSRVPNGTGDFETRMPTFNDNNENITPTEELFKTSQVNIFPNPAKDVINIHFESILETAVTISLYNSIGQRVLYRQINDQKTSLAINNLSSGIYLLTGETEGEGLLLSKKLIIE